MGENAKLIIGDKTIELPMFAGTEAEKALDISKLRAQTEAVTFDNGFANTGACQSAITFLEGDKGILRYRGYPIEQVAEKSSFIETAYLLIYGNLPNKKQLNIFEKAINAQLALPPKMLKIFEGYPKDGHPMGLLAMSLCSLSGYYPELTKPKLSPQEFDLAAAHLIAKVNTIACYSYRKIKKLNYTKPKKDLNYIENFLQMMFSKKLDQTIVKALNALLILHADHEQNCSTSTVRFVGSSQANIFASVSGGTCALWGPLHGGANQEVVEMLEDIHKGGNVNKAIEMAKDKNSGFRLMGFGHRVYKNFDPRAKIIKKHCHDLFQKLGIKDPLLDIAVQLEAAALKDPYFIERKLYPNVDFYSGLIYKALGIPTEMFTVMFALGRMPGWIAHWKEMREDANSKIGRPRQIYTGATVRDFVEIGKRS